MDERHLPGPNDLPLGVRAKLVTEPDFVSFEEARRLLNISPLRWRLLISNHHLDAAMLENGQTGITRASLGREVAWRQTASAARRFGRIVGDVAKNASP
jgi:hypothetical protein